MSEDNVILQYLLEHGSITPAIAYEIAGCLAMHSAAARLRKKGFAIECKMRSGNGKRWGEYILGRIDLPAMRARDMAMVCG